MRSGNSGNPCPDTQLYVSVATVSKLGEPRKLARFDMAGGQKPPATLSIRRCEAGAPAKQSPCHRAILLVARRHGQAVRLRLNATITAS
ncbi:MAG: hypothetical protein TUN42_00290 [Dehalogenimonas sp.]